MVDTIAATLNAVVANGGKIKQPIGMDAPEITVRFSDPAGNVLGLGGFEVFEGIVNSSILMTTMLGTSIEQFSLMSLLIALDDGKQ
jgi:hypothetical protein